MRSSRLFATALLLAALGLAGCKSNCRVLSEKLCDCEPTNAARDRCLRAVGERESQVDVTSEDEARCGELIEGCSCQGLDTPEGREACGLAR